MSLEIKSLKGHAARILMLLAPIVAFSIALFFLTNFLKEHSYNEIAGYFLSFSTSQIYLAVGLTIASYMVLTGYDFLGFMYIKKTLPPLKIALTSFLAFSISNSVGLAGLAGNSIRFRNYARWGLSSGEILKIILCVSASFWLGFFTVGGIALVFNPVSVSTFIDIPPLIFQIIGGVFLISVIGYLSLCALRKQPVRIKSEIIQPPSLRLAISQIFIAAADWLLAGAVLYILLPSSDSLTFWLFLAIFCTSQTISLITHVPGGVGILEALVVFFVSPDHHPTPPILAALVAYRIIYYLIPLVCGLAVLASFEIFLRRKPIVGATKKGWGIVSATTPFLISWSTFLAGGILLWSAFTPGESNRLQFIERFLHLGVIESSHFLSGIVGAFLLVLGRGLQNRSFPAYRYASIALFIGAILSFLKGGDYEEGTLLLLICFFLWRSKRHFYRQSQAVSKVVSSFWDVSITISIIGCVWIGFLSFKDVAYSPDLWSTFTLESDASRFLRASIGAISCIVVFLFYQLLYPKHVPAPAKIDKDELKKVIGLSTKTIGYLALLEDKRVLFSREKDAFIMYAIQGHSWIALGDPIGNSTAFETLLWDFRDLADSYGGRPIFYQTSPEELYMYAEFGMKFLKLGEEAIVDLEKFSLEGRDAKNLRAALNKFHKSGASVEIVPKDHFDTIFPDITRISESWLKEKNAAEKGFSLGYFKKDYLREFSTALVKVDGKIVGFANVWETANKTELSIDLMRHDPSAPNGVMDALFTELMVWGKAQGFKTFNLGMAPLAGLQAGNSWLSWNKIGNFIFDFGENYYNFQGLRQYKEKFNPDWEARYLAYTGSSLQALTDVTLLISGGVKGVFKK